MSLAVIVSAAPTCPGFIGIEYVLQICTLLVKRHNTKEYTPKPHVNDIKLIRARDYRVLLSAV